MYAQTEDTIRRASQSVVRIYANHCHSGGDRGSTGFVWPQSNTVVTALHVVSDCDYIEVYSEFIRASRQVRLTRVLRQSDLAMLEVSQIWNVPPIKAPRRVALQPGDALIALGYPHLVPRIEGTSLRTRFGGTRLRDILPDSIGVELAAIGINLDIDIINFEGHVIRGMSGGPVVDRAGYLVAVAVGGVGDAEVYWGIPTSYLPKLISSQETTVFHHQNDHLFDMDSKAAPNQTGKGRTHDLPKSSWHEIGREWIQKNKGPLIAVMLSLLALITLSSSIILILLQQDVFLIRQLAPWFYLTGLGQRKLFRAYRKDLVSSPDIQDDAVRYVDLPYEWNGANGQTKLSQRIEESLRARHNLEIIAEGGRGKTALCRCIAVRLVKNQLALLGRRRLQPVIVDGLGYNGRFLDGVVNAMKRSHAYVNPTIVESQLAMGNLLIMFDGFSEIRETFRTAAELSDIPDFIKQHCDTPFIFTSRSPLPTTVEQALRHSVIVQLKDVDAETQQVFLAQHLNRGSREVDAVIRQMNASLPEMPRIPLMLKLIAAVYDQTGRVPTDRATLFSQYADQLLRADATGIGDPTGLKFAMRHLVRESHLRSGGDRGLSVDEAVRLLGLVREELTNYEVRLSPIALVNLFCRAGVLKRTVDYLKFFHDSFESYFGARALLVDFQRRNYELLLQCQRNKRLGETWEFLMTLLDATEKQRLLVGLSVEAGNSVQPEPNTE